MGPCSCSYGDYEHPMKPGLLIKHDLAQFRYPLLSTASDIEDVPEHIDRRAEMLVSSHQGTTPKCAAFAMAGCVEHVNWKRGIKQQVDPDPIYALAKELDGFPDEEGTTLEAVARAAAQLKLLPIDLNTLKVVRREGMRHAVFRYGVVLSAFMATTGWADAKPNGWIIDGGDFMGGHAVVTVGYSKVEKPNWVAIQNSWGELSGWRGFARMSAAQFDSEFVYGLVWDLISGA
jgi:C1A family cysteine protease